MNPAARSDWWVSFYDDTFADLVLAEKDGDAALAVAFLIEKLSLQPGSRVLDQGCGTGRLTLPLAARLLEATGVDVNARYIERARAGARARGLSAKFHAADAGAFLPLRPMDGAFNWATSFGYWPDDASNLKLLKRACQALRPGGRFALDYTNVPRLMREFESRMVRRFATDHGEVVLHRDSHLDLQRRMLDQRWTWMWPDGRRSEREGSTRLYRPEELAGLLFAAGFGPLEFHGGVRGEAYDEASPRCIVVAVKEQG